MLGLFLVWLTAPLSVEAGTAKPKAVIEEIFSKVKEEKISESKIMQAEVNRLIDFDEMAAKVLSGKELKVSQKQRQWFNSTLKSIITKTVYPASPDFLKGVKIQYTDESTKKDRASITSEVLKKGEITEVRYDLRLIKGHWLVVDIAIDDESWVESIREEVQNILLTKNWAELEKRMNQRLKELNESKKTSK